MIFWPLLIGFDLERRILLAQPLESLVHLGLVGLCLGLDGHRKDRLGELHHLERDRVLRIAQRVAGH